MATSDTYTLVISDAGIPSPHAALHYAGGGDEISVALSQIDDVGANTVLGNATAGTAAVTAIATTGTGSVVRATGPTITLGNATGLPLTTGVTGLLPIANGGTGVSTLNANSVPFLQTPTSANLKTLVSDETGEGALVFGTNPLLTTPTIASPTISGTPVFSSPLADTNGGTGVNSLGAGVSTFLQTPTSANLLSAVTGATGTGALVFGTGPSLTSPTIATPIFSSPLTQTNGGTGISSLGSGIPAFLGTPSAANLKTAVVGNTGSGDLVFATSPVISSPTINGSPIFSSPLDQSNGGTGYTTIPFGQIYLIAGTTSQTLTDTVFAKANGSSTTFDYGTGFTDAGASYRLTVTDNFSGRPFMVYCEICVTNTANETIGLRIAKNGSTIAGSEVRENTGGTAADAENQHMANLSTCWVMPLELNDYIEPYLTAYISGATLAVVIRRFKMVIVPI